MSHLVLDIEPLDAPAVQLPENLYISLPYILESDGVSYDPKYQHPSLAGQIGKKEFEHDQNMTLARKLLHAENSMQVVDEICEKMQRIKNQRNYFIRGHSDVHNEYIGIEMRLEQACISYKGSPEKVQLDKLLSEVKKMGQKWDFAHFWRELDLYSSDKKTLNDLFYYYRALVFEKGSELIKELRRRNLFWQGAEVIGIDDFAGLKDTTAFKLFAFVRCALIQIYRKSGKNHLDNRSLNNILDEIKQEVIE